MLKEGDIAPDFTLNGVSLKDEIKDISLSEFEGKNVILYFYNNDSSIVCTETSCPFRDRLNIINNAVVIGISTDDIRTHVEFKEKCFLNFVLLNDEDHKIAELYNVWDKNSDTMITHTFLLNGDRKIMKIWNDPSEDLVF